LLFLGRANRHIAAAAGAGGRSRGAGGRGGGGGGTDTTDPPRVRVGYITVVDACRVHNSMMRALFDTAVVGHRRTEAVTFVWSSHMIERRAGYASAQVCGAADIISNINTCMHVY